MVTIHLHNKEESSNFNTLWPSFVCVCVCVIVLQMRWAALSSDDSSVASF